ncbi:Exodeoxyribonuclease 8 [Planctomycetes bacterium Poly30]|uniref:Exodeoxyribonuclease 8 n=1 Tax=Saltatorellus ferox TaxID=2528018 RepID=A0A518EYZ7_9BACT|nr:Exodeoxyribonuclease 8 [Planctomycetes bacterium Poly30]
MSPAWNIDDPQPGIYHGLPAEAYHACKAAVSRSTLRQFDLGDPAAVKRYIDKGIDTTPAMDRGSAVDVGIFDGMAAFHEQFARKPKFTGPGAVAARQAWEKEAAGDGITYMTDAPYEKALKMIECIRANDAASALFDAAEPQMSIFWRDEDTGLMCKARPDAYVKSKGWSLDLKTSGSLDDRKLGYTIVDYAADVQAAMVRDGLLANGLPWRGHCLVTVTEKPAVDGNHDMRLDLLSESWVLHGEARFIRWSGQYKACLESDEWPGRADGVNVLEMPKWLHHQFSEMSEMGPAQERFEATKIAQAS